MPIWRSVESSLSESVEAAVDGEDAEEARRKQEAAEEHKSQQRDKMLFIGLAYAATIGGVAMLTGTPTNLILLEALRKCAFITLVCTLSTCTRTQSYTTRCSRSNTRSLLT